MVQRALLVQTPLRRVMIAAGQSLMTTDDFEEMLRDLDVFDTCLTKLQEVTTKIQADKYPTIAKGINYFLIIKRDLKTIRDNPASNNRKQSFAAILLQRLQQRLGTIMLSGLQLCGAALDLRYCHQVPAASRARLVEDLVAHVVTLRQAYKSKSNLAKIQADIPALLELIISERNHLLDNNINITDTHTVRFWHGSLAASLR